jgi:hypothetical protein
MIDPWKNPAVQEYSNYLADSFARLTGKTLPHSDSAESLYHAPFVLVSHGIEADPVFRYGNLAAQKLWKISWEKFVIMPSRLSAEQDAQEERQRLLQQAQTQGYVDHYQGIRIDSEGKRFRIKDCMLWNVTDVNNQRIGQAAVFDTWEWL